MSYKNKGVQKKYQKDWYQRKKAGLPTRTTPTRTPEERRKRQLEIKRKWNKITRKKVKEFVNKEIGNRCLFCGYEKRLICHRKDGSSHEKLSSLGLRALKTEIKIDKYIRVCFKCHKAIHWCMDNLGMSWKDIEKYMVSK
ncbi:MAG: hypothetical protein GTN38_01940 [Candidatus Aenigmarchaeota archaeon]|nr:hypothetical protein [Candidatus Aenigmarchaeota archaeon]NIP40316.1 hypothetical protein [Candidatus Aenigmarchaeota archaeon]NIQ17810.1 hypothetical protein [Candidatus Aenigmarchaeota archaeon]NIS73191.1 hypothetical protein [Candidatus Aenigmarchaeota archaeon]